MGSYHQRRKKSCPYTSKEITTGERQVVDYKDLVALGNYVQNQFNGKMVSRRVTGVSALYQRRIAKAIKLARFLALMPYCEYHK